MKKKLILLMTSIALSSMACMTSPAAEWKLDDAGWWYQFDDGTYAQDEWCWIDGNGDGYAELYLFDENGYCPPDTLAADGYRTDENGARVEGWHNEPKRKYIETQYERDSEATQSMKLARKLHDW